MTDIVMVAHNRRAFTEKAIRYLYERTPRDSYNLIVVDNGSTDGTKEMLKGLLSDHDMLVELPENIGLEAAKMEGLLLVETDRFVDTDNDILVPMLEPDWLSQLNNLMDCFPDFGAISLRCQILVGVGPIFKDAPAVKENSVAGGSMRLMDTALVRQVGGWRKEHGQNGAEEWHISGRIQAAGKKVGYARDLFCFHCFGEDHQWGYGETEDHRHPGRRCDYVDSMFPHDPLTLVPSTKLNQ